MNKPNINKKSKTRDLKVKEDVKGGFNPQPDPPRGPSRRIPPGPC